MTVRAPSHEDFLKEASKKDAMVGTENELLGGKLCWFRPFGKILFLECALATMPLGGFTFEGLQMIMKYFTRTL